MSDLTRVSISLDETLLTRFDQHIEQQGYPTRSKAMADLIRQALVEQEWTAGDDVAAAIVMVYDHHKRDLTNRLTHLQHEYHEMVISAQHIHLDHHNCLEIVIVRGAPKLVRQLAEKIKGTKGVKFSSLAAASTGQGI